ncbi:MAG: leucine--tRNA ligase [Nanoarchaeota archaeon]|nr:leucine--tRNA ligase [Nanoarchaeota archaeon]
MDKSAYDFRSIEKKWAKIWEDDRVFEVREDKKKKKFYVLDMFPYPSGAGLHMGHAFVFSLGDIFARFKRLKGFNVLYPIGYDALGLPAENAAIKAGIPPKKYTEKSIVNFMKQQKAMGWSYDWSRAVNTSDPSFYKGDQWIFLKMLEKGIAYRKKAPVNYCPKCETVLANEQVVNGKCWRHEDTNVTIKHLEQWFFKISNYADELLEGINNLDWPETAKKLQRNWIGKSTGAEIDFEINGEKWPIFTTRPDTIYGVTFMVVSAQHERLSELVSDEQKIAVDKFLKKIKSVSMKEMGDDSDLDKEGVFTGSYAIHPLTNENIPIYAGNFVVADYGSGMVMAVPAHDKRDFEFAEKYNIPIKVVVEPVDYEIYERNGQIPRAYTGNGSLVNSENFNGEDNLEAMDRIVSYLEKKKRGKKSVQFRLRDWLISRQRYWGTPIPIIYCDSCGIVSVPEKDLPVELPSVVKFGKGNPLTTNSKWLNTKCPKCDGRARRETDTMDTFANSSWYFLRYADPKNEKKIFDEKKVDYWCPVDQYIGGPEHITAHLIYVRFYTKFLRDLGLLSFDEPALRYFTNGIVHGSDGEKMSKSRGNVVEPLDMINKYGADSLRLALVSFASPENDTVWDEKIVSGSHKFLTRVYNYFLNVKFSPENKSVLSKLNSSLNQIEEDIEKFRHNLAVIKIRQLFDYFSDKGIDKESAKKFLILLSVYCPFISEELWNNLGEKNSINKASWPEVDDGKIDSAFEKEEGFIDKLVVDVNNILGLLKEKGGAASKLYVYSVPMELDIYLNNVSVVEKRTGLSVSVYAVNDKNKYDPNKKSSKAKPGKPGIYLE